MIAMDINKTAFWYCLYTGSQMLTDSDGYKTGEKKLVYSEPVKMEANISAAKGNSEAEMFGTNLEYSRVIVTCDMDCPIDENSVLFVDKAPSFDDAGSPQFDYVVKRVARSLNVVSIAIDKVRDAWALQ